MLELLHAERDQLTARKSELEGLLEDAQAKADGIAAKANAEIEAINTEATKHAEELAGIKHTLNTLHALVAKAEGHSTEH